MKGARLDRAVAAGVVMCYVSCAGNSLIVFGGIGSTGSKHNSVHVCDLKVMRWRRLAMERDAATPSARHAIQNHSKPHPAKS